MDKWINDPPSESEDDGDNFDDGFFSKSAKEDEVNKHYKLDLGDDDTSPSTKRKKKGKGKGKKGKKSAKEDAEEEEIEKVICCSLPSSLFFSPALHVLYVYVSLSVSLCVCVCLSVFLSLSLS